jgi:hypothetical protein
VTLAVVALVAIAVAVGGFALVDRSTTVAPKPMEVTSTAILPVTHVLGLIKAGLQPRPFSEIPTQVETSTTDVPDGFVRLGRGDFRPKPVGWGQTP